MKYKNKKAEDWRILKRILPFLKPFKREFIIVTFCILLTSGINVVQPLINKILMDQGLVAKNFEIVLKYALFTLILVIVSQVVGLLETVEYSGINSKFSYTLFKTAFRKMLNFHMPYFDNKNFSEITNNLATDVNNVTKITDRSTFLVIGQVFQIISGIVGLCIIDWRLMLLVLSIIPFKLVIVRFLASKRKKVIKEYLSQNRSFYSWLGDCINGIKEIKLWNLKYLKIGQFIAGQRDIIKSNRKLAYLDNYNQSAETVLYGVLNFFLYLIGAFMIIQNRLTVGGLFAFITYSVYVTNPISVIINIIYNYANVVPSAVRLFDFFDTEPEEIPLLTEKKFG